MRIIRFFRRKDSGNVVAEINHFSVLEAGDNNYRMVRIPGESLLYKWEGTSNPAFDPEKVLQGNCLVAPILENFEAITAKTYFEELDKLALIDVALKHKVDTIKADFNYEGNTTWQLKN